MELNKNDARRCEILGISGNYQCGGINSFCETTVDQLEQLVAEQFADPEDCHNDAPSIEEIIEFMKSHDGFVVGGYAVSPERDDYRVSIDAIEYAGVCIDNDTIVDFVKMFRYADEFCIDGGRLYAWFD